MFHKEGSSSRSGPNKKKSMDVPIKKSERRALRKVAHELLFPPQLVETAEAMTHTAELNAILDQTFLEGTLLQRKVMLPSTRALLYTRNPSPSDTKNDPSVSTWPYYQSPQIVWMALEEGKQWTHGPTLALLALLPPVALQHFPTVIVPSAVSKFMCRGAHLMRAGMWSVPAVCKNGIVAVCVKGNPQPMAVGRVTKDTTLETIGYDTKGMGVEVWTCYGDDIWNSQKPRSTSNHNISEEGAVSPIGGAPYDHGNYGNIGFLEGAYVSPIVAADDEEQESNSSNNSSSDCDDEIENQELGGKSEGEKEREAPLSDSATLKDDEASSEEQGNTVLSTANQIEAVNIGDVDTDKHIDEEFNSDEEDIDNPNDIALYQAFCRALVALEKADLPMTTANFYAQHILQHSRTPIQLKQTSYKKLGHFLSEQVHVGLLTLGPDKSNTDPRAYVTSVNRGHIELRHYRKEQQQNHDDSKNSTKKKTAIVNLYIIPHHFVSLMRLDQDDVKATYAKSPERQGTCMLTTPEARSILEKYIIENNLVDSIFPDQVKVDGPLCDALYKKAKGNYPTEVSRKDLATEWLSRMEPGYAVVQMPGSRITQLSRGTPPKVTMEVSMRSGRKFITRVRGLEEYGIDASHFSKDVVKRFACSGAIETDPVGRAALKKGHAELVFQGNLAEELQALLLGDEKLTSHGGAKGGEYCLPKNVIKITLKKGVKTKR